MDEIKSLTQTRGNLYGKFTDNARATQQCLKVFSSLPYWEDAPDVHKEAVHMILGKMSRCFSGGSYEYDDHWADIQGYADKVREYIQEGE